jgi:hypothetical protein
MSEDNSTNLLPYESEKFISNENLDAYYYAEPGLVHFIWKKRSTGDEYRQPFLDTANFTETHPGSLFLSDIREQGIVGPDDRKWFETEALPLAIKNGLKKTALIFDGNAFKLYYLNMIMKHFKKGGIQMKFFNSFEEAREWLFQE